ncbi:trimethylguanosine synthase-like [Aphis craccivora]|uniref:Trimethylguanosine synthase-like n=1 Tax=Aphis craccivora TaxID=307492 RepID=A0A6G0ZBS1_APHCR|nr:trimethylguanosine synthase-like [Aphis craccivora]
MKNPRYNPHPIIIDDSGIARSHIPLILTLSAAPELVAGLIVARSNYSKVDFTAEMSDVSRMPVSQRLRHRSTARRGCSSDHGPSGQDRYTDSRLLTLRGARRVMPSVRLGCLEFVLVFGFFTAILLGCFFLLDVEGLSCRTRLISFKSNRIQSCVLLVKDFGKVEIQQNVINEKLNSLTAFFGNFHWNSFKRTKTGRVYPVGSCRERTKNAIVVGQTDRRQMSPISSIIGPTGGDTEVASSPTVWNSTEQYIEYIGTILQHRIDKMDFFISVVSQAFKVQVVKSY